MNDHEIGIQMQIRKTDGMIPEESPIGIEWNHSAHVVIRHLPPLSRLKLLIIIENMYTYCFVATFNKLTKLVNDNYSSTFRSHVHRWNGVLVAVGGKA